MSKKRGNICRSMEKKVVAMDGFAEPISLNYSGETSYKTIHGGLLTLIAVFAVSYFAVVRYLKMQRVIEWKPFQQELQAQESDLTMVDFNQLFNVTLAVEFDYPYVGLPNDEGYSSISAKSLDEKKKLYGQYVDNIEGYLFV